MRSRLMDIVWRKVAQISLAFPLVIIAGENTLMDIKSTGKKIFSVPEKNACFNQRNDVFSKVVSKKAAWFIEG